VGDCRAIDAGMTNVDPPFLPYLHGVAAAMYLLRGKWTIPVLAALGSGEVRFTDLIAQVNDGTRREFTGPGLSDRVLTDTLERMLADRLIARRREGDQFPFVGYRLLPLGQSLLAAVRPLAEWAQDNQRVLAEIDSRGSSRPAGRS
jgi:DNA-binding HxlR family transcriptional regulator